MMVCINPDGSLGASARGILASLIQSGSLEDIARNTSLPVHRIQPCLQELLKAGLVVEKQGSFQITTIGVALLNS
jgi:predicted transcriptional regulator